MKNSDLVFIGIKGSVVALHRATGAQMWASNLKGSGFVNVVVLPGAVIAAADGEIFCLDPLTGQTRWHNPLKGFGLGLATIATETNANGGVASAVAEQNRLNEAATHAAT